MLHIFYTFLPGRVIMADTHHQAPRLHLLGVEIWVDFELRFKYKLGLCTL